MDISDTLAPNSDQLDAIELLGAPRTFTIESVSKGNAEQPVQIHLVGFPRPWRPGKSMRRVLAACWGTDASLYAGRSVTLYCDESVVFGKDRVGGTRIRALSHIDGRKQVPLLVSRGKSAMFTVEPLAQTTTAATLPPTADDVAACTDINTLKGMWRAAGPDVRALIEARVTELNAPEQPAPTQPNPATEEPPLWPEDEPQP